jgi:DNA-directed RNA polymerase specialized sigma24 family protein
MRRESAITQESLAALLEWLDPNPDMAGHRYETIRAGLIRIFISHGFNDAEDLADLTINRVIARLPDIKDGYVGEPAAYFRGVARKIILEARRRKEVATDKLPERLEEIANVTDEYECLLKCLKLLSREKRELILDYHLYEGKDKIAQHKLQAQELGMSNSALRVQAHRIRETLEKCVLKCVKELCSEINSTPVSIIKGGLKHEGLNQEQ